MLRECSLIAEPPSGAPYYRKAKKKKNHELMFSWLTWLAVLLVGAYVMTMTIESCNMAAIPNDRLTETWSHVLGLSRTWTSCYDQLTPVKQGIH